MHNIKRAFNTSSVVEHADDQSSDHTWDDDTNTVADGPVAVPGAPKSAGTVRRRLISQCRAVITEAGMCSSRESLVRALTHTKAALCNLAPLNGGCSAAVTVRPRTARDKMLDNRLRFSNMQAKRSNPPRSLTEPYASNSRGAKRKLPADEDAGEPLMEVAATSGMTVHGKSVFGWHKIELTRALKFHSNAQIGTTYLLTCVQIVQGCGRVIRWEDKVYVFALRRNLIRFLFMSD